MESEMFLATNKQYTKTNTLAIKQCWKCLKIKITSELPNLNPHPCISENILNQRGTKSKFKNFTAINMQLLKLKTHHLNLLFIPQGSIPLGMSHTSGTISLVQSPHSRGNIESFLTAGNPAPSLGLLFFWFYPSSISANKFNNQSQKCLPITASFWLWLGRGKLVYQLDLATPEIGWRGKESMEVLASSMRREKLKERINILSKAGAEATCWVWCQRSGLGA